MVHLPLHKKHTELFKKDGDVFKKHHHLFGKHQGLFAAWECAKTKPAIPSSAVGRGPLARKQFALCLRAGEPCP